MKVVATAGGVKTEYWVDNYYGMPLQIIVDGDKEEAERRAFATAWPEHICPFH